MSARPTVVLVGEIYHADADKLLRTQADVLALDRPAPAEIAAALAGAHAAIVRYPHRIDAAVLAGAGKLSLLVPDEELEGQRAHLVFTAPDGAILAQREVNVGRNK